MLNDRRRGHEKSGIEKLVGRYHIDQDEPQSARPARFYGPANVEEAYTVVASCLSLSSGLFRIRRLGGTRRLLLLASGSIEYEADGRVSPYASCPQSNI